ncbi:Uncharacterised protein [Klebsiella quasipneumoniae]|nr:Uncharacterised protein [Klebsiella quasipneumoniae]
MLFIKWFKGEVIVYFYFINGGEFCFIYFFICGY